MPNNFIFDTDNVFLNESKFSPYSPLYNETPTNNLIVDSSRATLWMGDLEPWMDETFLKQLWNSYGEAVVIKLMRDKRTGLNCGYAFIGFNSTQAAQRILNTVHGTRMPNSNKLFRLNWASGGGIYDRKEDRAPEYSLFVGDLSNDVDETFLLSLFRSRYPSCHSAKIMTDPVTGLSRGYGFVRFSNQSEQQDAVMEMNGILCDNRPLRVSYATPKSTANNSNKNFNDPMTNMNAVMMNLTNSNNNNNNHAPLNSSYYHQLQQQKERYQQLELQAPALIHQPTDPSNTTVFVGGLSSPVTEEQLGQYFAPFGEVTYVKIPPGKGCGFVQYVSRSSAEQAIEKMNGFLIGTSRIRLSWGRSQADKNYLQHSNSSVMDQPLSPSTLSSSSITNNNNSNFQLRPLSPSLISPTSSSSLFNPYDNASTSNSFGGFSLFKSASQNSHSENDWMLNMTEQQHQLKQQQLLLQNNMKDNNNNDRWPLNVPF